MKKKFAIVFLSLFLVISLPFAAHANIVTATGKYLITAIKHIPGGAKVNATNTATGAKHAINHGVSAPALGAAIGGGIVGSLVTGGFGIAFQAITGLALDAVDWVMDKENNQIKWKKKGGFDADTFDLNTCSYKAGLRGLSPPYTIERDGIYVRCFASGVYFDAIVSGEPVAGAPPLGSEQYRHLPLVDLAKKVIEQADAGQVDSQKAIEEYVTNLAKDGKLDAELDNATDITKPDEPTKPEDPDKDCPLGTTKVDDVCVKPSDPDTPLFCNSGDFTRKVCDWIDWTQEEPTELVVKPVDVKDVDAENSNKINMSGECPAPYQLNFSVLGYEQSHSISYEPLCGALVLLKPIFVGSGALSGMFILMGYSRASNTGVNG